MRSQAVGGWEDGELGHSCEQHEPGARCHWTGGIKKRRSTKVP